MLVCCVVGYPSTFEWENACGIFTVSDWTLCKISNFGQYM